MPSFEPQNAVELFKQAFETHDPDKFRQILSENPEQKERINEPVAAFDSPIIIHVRSRDMLDVLLEAGADINAKSQWWAGGFGLLDSAEPELADYAVTRGATVTIHAAARLGHVDTVRRMLTENPELVRARGGDGQLPLHF